ncbi:pentatricopeptide repeat-containing protein At5g38730 [Fagus crenata]
MAALVSIASETRFIQSVCAIIVKGHWNNLLKPNIGSTLTSTTIHQVLLQLSLYNNNKNHGPSLSWAFFKWIESVPNYNHSLQCSWTMVHILTKHKHFKTAQDLLEKIALKDFLSSPTVLNALVRNFDDPDANSHVLSWLVIFFVNSRMTHDAIQVFEHMRVHRLKPHLHACAVLLNCLVKDRLTDMSGDVKKAEELLSEMELKCVFPDLFTYNTLISLYCKRSMHYEALAVQDRMERGGMSADILCEEGRIRDANKLLNEMSERKVVPDNVTCNTLINAYCKIGDMRSSLKVKNKLLGAGLKLDQFTYKALIHGFCKVHEMDSAKEHLFGMLDSGFSPSYCTYSWIIDAFCNRDSEDAVLKLPDELVQRGLCVDVSVYRALIRRLCKRERVDCAEKIFSIMQGKGISGDSVVYTALAYSYLKAGKATVASQMLDEMAKRRLRITLKIYKSFNASYVGDGSILPRFWDHVVERGLMSKNIIKEMQQMNPNISKKLMITAHEAQLEQERKEREAQSVESVEGGWRVVVHHKGRKKTTDVESGTTVSSVAKAVVEDKMAKKKDKEVGLDFYRFQRIEAQKNSFD